jgi:xanthine/CO dehydrogenase XdhC/CoxF family maturation factor
MTAELRAIVRRIGELRASGRPAVLATLVKTEGSSYRTLGTRMLIERDGTLTGFLSAGCLEADLAQRAEAVFQTGQPATVTYDTSAPGDIVWGLGLGCNGVLTVLLEPMDTPSVERALAAIAQCLETRSPGALAIVIATPPGSPIPLGCATVHSDSPSAGLPHGVLEDVRRSVGGTSVVRRYGVAEGELEILIESLRPPHSILIYGAGADVPALCQVAQQLGWHVTVADRRSDKTLRNAAPQADRVLSLDAAQLGESSCRTIS